MAMFYLNLHELFSNIPVYYVMHVNRDNSYFGAVTPVVWSINSELFIKFHHWKKKNPSTVINAIMKSLEEMADYETDLITYDMMTVSTVCPAGMDRWTG